MLGAVVVDGGLELGNALEDAAPDALVGDFGEEVFDEIGQYDEVGVKCSLDRG